MHYIIHFDPDDDRLYVINGYTGDHLGDGTVHHDALVELVAAVLHRDDGADILHAAAGPLVEQFAADYRAAAGSDVRGDRQPEPVQPTATDLQRAADGGDGPGLDDLRRRFVDTVARWVFLTGDHVPYGIRGAADSLIKAIDLPPARDRVRDGS